jgi:hypothetical protein
VDNKADEKTGSKTRENQAEKDPSKFNWVAERSSCTLPRIYKALRSQIEEDVKARNDQRPKNSPYEFSVVETGADFSVLLQAKESRTSVVFILADSAIVVRDDQGNAMFEVTLTFTDDGKCKLHVNQEERDFWQVRRMALEDLMFRGH